MPRVSWNLGDDPWRLLGGGTDSVGVGVGVSAQGGDELGHLHHVVSRRVALGFRNRTDLADSLHFTVRTLADIEHGVRKASLGTYAMRKQAGLGAGKRSVDTSSWGSPPARMVSMRRTNLNAPSQGYALRATNPGQMRRRDSWPAPDAGSTLRRRLAEATGVGIRRDRTPLRRTPSSAAPVTGLRRGHSE